MSNMQTPEDTNLSDWLDPRVRPTITLDETYPLLGIGRSTAYACAARGEIPTLKLGRRLVVPTAALRRLLGLDPAGDDLGDAA